jgi:hypothetical protein
MLRTDEDPELLVFDPVIRFFHWLTLFLVATIFVLAIPVGPHKRKKIRHRGIPRSQIPLHGRHRPVSVTPARPPKDIRQQPADRRLGDRLHRSPASMIIPNRGAIPLAPIRCAAQ